VESHEDSQPNRDQAMMQKESAQRAERSDVSGSPAAPPRRMAMLTLLTRFGSGVLRGPMSRNLGAAPGVQLCLLVSGTLSARLLGPENRGYVAILSTWPSAIGQLGAVGMSLAATY